MFGYRSNVPKVRLTTDRMIVRLVYDRDAWRLAEYYAENRLFLKPWEPIRDESHCYPSGWQARLSMINELHKQGSAFYFALLDPDEKEIRGVANFTNVVRGSFYACYLGYSLGDVSVIFRSGMTVNKNLGTSITDAVPLRFSSLLVLKYSTFVSRTLVRSSGCVPFQILR